MDTYGHLAIQGNHAAVDRLDNPALPPHLPATYTQPNPSKKGLAEANPLKILEREMRFEPATLSWEESPKQFYNHGKRFARKVKTLLLHPKWLGGLVGYAGHVEISPTISHRIYIRNLLNK